MAPSKLAKQTRKVAPQDAAAAHRLAEWYFRGEEDLNQNLELYLEWERVAAERGCGDAQFALGVAYSQGTLGLQVAPAIAFAWFRKAALQGRAFPTLDAPLMFLSAQLLHLFMRDSTCFYMDLEGHTGLS